MNKELKKKYIVKIINKINSNHKYNDKSETYRETIQKQIRSYKNIISSNKIDNYKGFIIR